MRQKHHHFYRLGTLLAVSVSLFLSFGVAKAGEKITLKCTGDLMIQVFKRI